MAKRRGRHTGSVVTKEATRDTPLLHLAKAGRHLLEEVQAQAWQRATVDGCGRLSRPTTQREGGEGAFVPSGCRSPGVTARTKSLGRMYRVPSTSTEAK